MLYSPINGKKNESYAHSTIFYSTNFKMFSSSYFSQAAKSIQLCNLNCTVSRFRKAKESVVEKKPRKVTKDHPFCTKCETRCIEENNFNVCPKCGAEYKVFREAPVYDTPYAENHNVSNRGNTFFIIKSNKNRAIARAYRRTCGKWSSYKPNKIRNELLGLFTVDQKLKVSPSVIESTIEMYKKVRCLKSKRAKGKTGMMLACLYVCAMEAKEPLTETYLCATANIRYRHFSQSMTALKAYAEMGFIQKVDYSESCIYLLKRYMEELQIEKHYDFLKKVLEISDSDAQKTKMVCEYKNSTKCAGAIWFLRDRCLEIRELVTEEALFGVCRISSKSYQKYFKFIRSLGVELYVLFYFSAYPMPLQWKGIALELEKMFLK